MPKKFLSHLLSPIFYLLLLISFFLFLFVSAFSPSSPSAPSPRSTDTPRPPRPALGINLNGPADWNSEFPFANLFSFSRPWISQQTGKPFGKGPSLSTDPDGWVASLLPGCSAEAFISTAPVKPSGAYSVFYDGSGSLSFPSHISVLSQSPNSAEILVPPTPAHLSLTIRTTDPSDPIRNIRVFSPLPSDGPWRKGFLDLWRGVRCIRFMDFMKTNNSPIRHWEDRPRLTDASFSRAGVPLELMIDLANRLHADPWFCIPHQADDAFVRLFAQQVSDLLDPSLTAYIEYSNELWNPQFSQHRYAAEQGSRLGLSSNPAEAAALFNAKRSQQIFRIFSQTFGKKKNFSRVLAIQSGQTFLPKKMLDFQDLWQEVDAIASAPYLTLSPAEKTDKYHPLAASTVATWSLNQLFDHLQNEVLPQTIRDIRANATLAKEYNLPLIAYEGGQHLTGVLGAENNAALTALFHQANASPQMGALYRQYLTAWQNEGGSLFCHFSSVATWTKWGSWGLLESFDQPPLSQPKFRAVHDWASSIDQPLTSH